MELTSCSDEITSSGFIGFDSARFLWHQDTIPIIGINPNLYTPDSNNIFIVGMNENSEYDVAWITVNSKQYFSFPTEEAYLMLGADNSSFLFGMSKIDNWKKPIAWKWSGTGFDKLTTNYIDSISIGISSGCFINQNEIWLGCTNGVILKFNGIDFQKSNIPDTLVIKRVFLDRDNKLKLLAYYFNYNVGMTYTIFEYKNDAWEKIYTGFYARSEKSYDILNKDVFAYGEDGIYSFDGQNLHKVIQYYKMSFLYRGAGTSLNDFIGIGRGNDIPYQGFVFHWNGKKWSKELYGFDGSAPQINMVSENYYIAINQDIFGTIIYKGQKK
ncbi:MAG: hypothetical protein PHN88_15170 [Ignavibacteria bacterium]|nr:hypothetical protein [Ignavibacteria bacterium]